MRVNPSRFILILSVYWQAATPSAPAMADATAMMTFSTMSQVKDFFFSISISVKFNSSFGFTETIRS